MKTNIQRSLGRPHPNGQEYCGPSSKTSFSRTRTRRLYLIEMGVAWDSLQIERGAEKLSKYGELCAVLRGQFPGYCLDIVPVVFGDLGMVTHHLVGDLGCLPTAGKTVSQITGMQRSVLCSVARILRSHLSACELAAWTLVGSAAGHRPARTASLPA